ncbi:MAG: TIR domain-containing protein [Saprospiraceae bacterium]|nr:TIR domain-containing protein [Saprospiraceae bacterium]
MGKKIFVSYKYADNLVRPLPNKYYTTVRDYVDVLQSKLDYSDHIYKGEDDGEDLGSLADSTIGSKLGDKIFDSTVTIVFISKGMKDATSENDQWIPWEISYSLREQSRQGRNSKTNAVLGVVLPDNYGTYDYYYRHNPECNSTTHFTNQLFTILRENMFNIKNPSLRSCNGTTIHEGESSYIKTVTWDEFIPYINFYIDRAVDIWRNRDNYNLRKNV